jgi:hypothetical protein
LSLSGIELSTSDPSVAGQPQSRSAKVNFKVELSKKAVLTPLRYKMAAQHA